MKNIHYAHFHRRNPFSFCVVKQFSLFSHYHRYYRCLGARIGSYSVLYDLGYYTDFDQLNIGSNCVINGYCWQIHSFEDRVFWVKDVYLGDNICVMPHAVIMGGARILDGTTLEPCSTVWKMMQVGVEPEEEEGNDQALSSKGEGNGAVALKMGCGGGLRKRRREIVPKTFHGHPPVEMAEKRA